MHKKALPPLSLLVFLLFVSFPLKEALAIHAIFKGAAPIPRKHGPIQLDMQHHAFLKTTQGKPVEKAIGQFPDEHRYELDLSAYPDSLKNVLADFYKNRLFRIELIYHPIHKPDTFLSTLIEENTKQYGPPRINDLTGIRLLFWDDGATRMILQIEETEQTQVHSVTYIDNDLFHNASRDRVQRETSGRANYGKQGF